MELFNKFENIYYEIFTRIVNGTYKVKNASDLKKVICYYLEEMNFEIDKSFLEYILEEVETDTYVYTIDDNYNYVLGVKSQMPVLVNNIEEDALKNLLKLEIAKKYLHKETIDKLEAKLDLDNVEWSLEDIKKKRMFKHGDTENLDIVMANIRKIIEAMKNQCPIKCDNNTRQGNVNYENQVLYPVKIEYSPINDKYRLFCIKVVDGKKKYIKMIISNMKNIEVLENEKVKNMEEFIEENKVDFLEFQQSNRRSITLYVDSEKHVIERCFRIFSFYKREAEYDSQKDIYILKIHYYSFDEAEIIKNILSLGHRVVVAEPQEIRNKIIERVKKSISNYGA